MASDSSPPPSLAVMSPAAPSLQTLQMQLLELILRFLPMYDKLRHLTRLSSSFPPLTPACFSEDSLKVSSLTVKALACSGNARSLLSRLRQLDVHAVPQRGEGLTGRQPPRLLVSVEAFTRL
jgi:hypothetical protein